MTVTYLNKSLKTNGFSLIEMAIALAVIGFLVGGLLKPMALTKDYKKIKYTDATLEQIKEALVGFAIVNNRLPCPAMCFEYNGKDSDCLNGIYDIADVGKETTDSAFCQQEGYLPWADLGIGKYDAWNNPFYYRVDKNYSAISGIISSLKTDSSEKLTVNYKQTGNNLTTYEKDGNSRIIAIILSHGKNDKAESSNKITIANDPTYVQGHYVGNIFDDRVTWLSKYTLTNHLAKSRDLPQ